MVWKETPVIKNLLRHAHGITKLWQFILLFKTWIRAKSWGHHWNSDINVVRQVIWHKNSKYSSFNHEQCDKNSITRLMNLMNITSCFDYQAWDRDVLGISYSYKTVLLFVILLSYIGIFSEDMVVVYFKAWRCGEKICENSWYPIGVIIWTKYPPDERSTIRMLQWPLGNNEVRKSMHSLTVMLHSPGFDLCAWC